jgi:hypothetical protein
MEQERMNIRLRPHHLLCMLTYVGKGYSSAFTTNYEVIIRRLRRGEDILVVSGPDDICSPLLESVGPHCLRASVTERDRLAAHDVGKFLACRVEAGHRITPDPGFLHRMREAFASGHIRNACIGCEWNGLCSSVMANSHGGILIRIKE